MSTPKTFSWTQVTLGLALSAVACFAACGESGQTEDDTELIAPEPLPDVSDVEDAGDTDDGGSDMGDLVEDTEDGDADDVGVVGDADAMSDAESDMGDDADTGPDLCGGEECGPQETCEDDVCKLPASVQCSGAIDKGSVAAGDTVTLNGDFTGDVGDGLTTSCSGDRPETPELVYSFVVEDDSLFGMTPDFPGSFDAKVEFRRSSCENPAADKTTCRDTDTGFWAAAGETVYVVVEHDSGPAASFSIDLTAEAAACNPDTYSCNAQDNVEFCDISTGTPTVDVRECPAGCNNGACTGDSCSNPIVVTGSGGTYAADGEAFSDEMDFTNANQCIVNTQQPTTDGSELVFEVALQAGETLTVEASNDDANHLLFLSSSCGPDPSQFACYRATDDERVTFTAQVQQTVYAIVDKWTRKIEPFDIRISVD